MEFIKPLFGQRLYLDANIFIYAYEAHPQFTPAVAALFQAVERGDNFAVTSELSLAEVLVRPIMTKNRAAQKAYRQAIQNSSHLLVHPMSREVLMEAARLRATSPLTMPDAIHAATARLAGCRTIITNDEQFASSLPARALVLSRLAQN